MERVSCELCGADDYTVVRRYRVDKYFEHLPDARRIGRVVVCKTCGYVYQNPRWDARELRAIYSEEMRRKRDPLPDNVERELSDAREAAAWILQQLPANGERPKRMLDIGSGHGFLLRAFQEQGWQAVGIEPRRSSGDYARRMFQVEVVQGYFAPEQFREPFELVTLTATLEHLPRPVDYLREIRKVLAPGGVVFIDVPNVHRPYVKFPRAFFVSIHLQLFSAVTLRHAFEQAGYDVITLDESHHPLLRALAQNPTTHAPPGSGGPARWSAGEYRQACASARRFQRDYLLRIGWKDWVKGWITPR